MSTSAVVCSRCGRPARGYAWGASGQCLCHTSDPDTDCYTKETSVFPMPKLDDDGRDGTLFGQRVSAAFVMALIAKLGGRVEVSMFQEIERMRSAGVRIIAAPKFSLTAPDVYQLVDRNGLAWPPVDPGPAPEGTPELEEGVIEGEIIDE